MVCKLSFILSDSNWVTPTIDSTIVLFSGAGVDNVSKNEKGALAVKYFFISSSPTYYTTYLCILYLYPARLSNDPLLKSTSCICLYSQLTLCDNTFRKSPLLAQFQKPLDTCIPMGVSFSLHLRSIVRIGLCSFHPLPFIADLGTAYPLWWRT